MPFIRLWHLASENMMSNLIFLIACDEDLLLYE